MFHSVTDVSLGIGSGLDHQCAHCRGHTRFSPTMAFTKSGITEIGQDDECQGQIRGVAVEWAAN